MNRHVDSRVARCIGMCENLAFVWSGDEEEGGEKGVADCGARIDGAVERKE